MKNIKSLFVSVMLIALAATSLGAAEENQRRAAIGERAMTVEQRADILKQKHEKEEEAGEQLPEKGNTEMGWGYTYGRAQWDAARHSVMSAGASGELVEIEDGSMFSVRPGDQWRVSDWRPGDIINVLPNHGWFFGLFGREYDYRLYNEYTGETVDVNLSMGPIWQGPYSWYITAIDDYAGHIYLQDGSIVQVDPSDVDIIRYWAETDHVIIGCNDGYHYGSYPQILINVATLDFVRVR